MAEQSLSCTNNSSLPGQQYFMIYPPLLDLQPPQEQTSHPLVSGPTVSAQDTSQPNPNNIPPDTTATWTVAPDGMTFLTLSPGQQLDAAAQTAVADGDTVTVSWTGDQLQADVEAGGPAGEVTVTFAAGIPPGAVVGLVAGPSPVTFPASPGITVAITPAQLSHVYVEFGTPPAPGGFSDVSGRLEIVFAGLDASVEVDLNNRLTQTA